MRVSIIIPVYNEEKYIAACIDSVLAFDYPQEKMEILIVDGMSTDKTRSIVDGYCYQYAFVKLLDNPKRIVPVAMNIGIVNANGEYVVRLDAHAFYPKEYLPKLIAYHQKLDTDNIGGVVVTKVKHQNRTSCAIVNVLSDRFGVGSSFRSGIDTIQEVDTVPFGCYRKSIFEQVGMYDERLVRNQDIELNKRIKKHGGKVILVPEIYSIYYARENFYALAKNNFENGKWNILTAYYTKAFSSLSLRHYIPLLFILSLLVPLLCCSEVSLAIFVVYLSVIGWRSTHIKANTDIKHQIWAFIILHFSYGFGEAAGIIQVMKAVIKGNR